MNGWINRETWCAHIWLTDEAMYYGFRALAVHSDTYAVAQAMRQTFEDAIPEDIPPFLRDLLEWAIVNVDWSAIAAYFKED